MFWKLQLLGEGGGHAFEGYTGPEAGPPLPVHLELLSLVCILLLLGSCVSPWDQNQPRRPTTQQSPRAHLPSLKSLLKCFCHSYAKVTKLSQLLASAVCRKSAAEPANIICNVRWLWISLEEILQAAKAEGNHLFYTSAMK